MSYYPFQVGDLYRCINEPCVILSSSRKSFGSITKVGELLEGDVFTPVKIEEAGQGAYRQLDMQIAVTNGTVGWVSVADTIHRLSIWHRIVVPLEEEGGRDAATRE